MADFAIDGRATGENVAKEFRPVTDGVWDLRLMKGITELPRGLTVAVKDRQENGTRIERTISVEKTANR